jgi:glycerol-3-phosphate dehydrogenase (NAD(P)+)
MAKTKIAVAGAGAWGTAIAIAASRTDSDVMIYAREKEVVDSINFDRENIVFLPNFKVEKNIHATSNLGDIMGAEIIFLVPPAQHVRSQCERFAAMGLNKDIPLVICSKGIENGTLLLMSEVLEETLINPYAIMSGPTFAHEVAADLKTHVSIAAKDKKTAEFVKKSIDSENFTSRINDDVVGSQIGGAIKNVIAIGCGMINALGFGENARAALITKGLQEIYELTAAKGGKFETVIRACGVGDLILTCSSRESRNYSFGRTLAIEAKDNPQDLLTKRKTVVEGVYTAESLYQLSEKMKLSLPVCNTIYEIIQGKKPASDIGKLI